MNDKSVKPSAERQTPEEVDKFTHPGAEPGFGHRSVCRKLLWRLGDLLRAGTSELDPPGLGGVLYVVSCRGPGRERGSGQKMQLDSITAV